MVDARLGAFTAIALAACAPKTLTILHTTDLHANVAAYDYLAGQQDPKRGLAKAATVIRAHTTPCTLTIDTGDAIQGAPLGPEPMAKAMNRVGYAAMALGNHDFDFGQETLRRFIAEASFPVLAGNVSGFKAYVLLDVCGVRVGILGLVTPKVAVWEPPEHVAGLAFETALTAARRLVPMMKAQGAELVVVAIHAGPDAEAGLPQENEAGAIAEQVPGVDVILSGHTHAAIPKLMINGVILSQPHRWGSAVGETTVVWKHGVVSKDSRLLPVDDASEASDLIDVVKPWHDKALAAMAVPIGVATATFEGGDRARFKDSALADLINAVQTQAAAQAGYPVDAAGVSIFSARAQLAKGALTMRDLYGVYPYDNTLCVLELTREDFKEALEQAARYFKRLRGPLPPEPDDVKAQGGELDWDLYSGVDYAVDLTKPVGLRVTLGNTPALLRVALNNYRASGGGGFPMLKRGKVLWQSQVGIRELLVDYVKARSPLSPNVTLNFRLLPDLYRHYF